MRKPRNIIMWVLVGYCLTFLLVGAAYAQCPATTTGDGLWPDVVGVTDGTIYIAHDVTIPDGFGFVVDDSIVVCAGGALRGGRGAIAFSVPDGYEAAGQVDGLDSVSDIGLYVRGTLDLQAPAVTSWLDAAPDGDWQDFRYSVERSIAVRPDGATLAAEPIGWQVGDTLVITTEQGDYEETTLTGISGREISFRAGLTGYALRYRDHVVLPKVANLSRRFAIAGGHTIFYQGAKVSVSGVQFIDGGYRGKLGRYPVHFHRMGQTDAVFAGNSIWSDGYSNRWITIHSTQGATIADNVMLRSRGHGVFMEMGDEYGNVLTGNLTIDVEYPEELPNVDEDLFPLVTSSPIGKTSNHFWVRQGNTYRNNASVGGDINAWPKYPSFGWLHGLAVINGRPGTDTLVEGYDCLGCGAFGAWSYIEDGSLTIRDAGLVYNRVAGWYPVLDGTVLEDSAALLNTWNTPWEGQIFAQTFDGNRAVIRNSHAAGAYGLNLHYVGDVVWQGGSITAGVAVIKPNYFDNTATFHGVETYGPEMFGQMWGSHKRSAPVPVWMRDGTTFNGQIIDGMYAKHPAHSRFFDTIGDPVGTAIQVVEQPAHWLPKPSILDRASRNQAGWNGDAYYRSVTPSGQPEGQMAFAGEHESMYQRSLELGNQGYPHGFPAGTYDVRYYHRDSTTRNPIPLGFGDIFTVGDAEAANRPPVAQMLFTGTDYPDTDGKPGEVITVNGTGLDPDGDVLLVEWLVNGEGQSTELMPALSLPDGYSALTLRVSDGEHSDEVSAEINVGAPVVTEPGLGEIKNAVIEILTETIEKVDAL